MTFEQIKDMLAMVDTPADKLEMVMDLGAHMPDVPSDAVCADIIGCASHAEICRMGNQFYGRADSALVRGIVAIVTAMVDGHTPDEIKQMDLAGMFSALGLPLGAGRLNGVNSMIRFLQNL